MNKFKKLLALFIASTMIMSSFAMGAFADEDTYKIPSSESTDGDLAIDSTITITGLAAGDTVNLYRVIEWSEGEGWILSAGFEALGAASGDYASDNVKAILDNTAGVTLDKTDAEKIAKLAKEGATAIESPVIDGDTYTYTSTEKPGMYLALVQPADANTLYNPIIVSADFTTDNMTNEIDSSEKMGTSAVAKKSVVTAQKKSEDDDESGNTHNIGDEVPFTVTTTIPAYSQSYDKDKLHFIVTDTLSEGLEIKGNVSVTAEGVDSTVDIEEDLGGFTVTFDPEDIWNLQTPVEVTITYNALITGDAPYDINEETNTIIIDFSNDPQDDNGHGHLKDVTKHYSFTIDGELFGDKEYLTTELVKVGLDSEGKPIITSETYPNGSSHSPLEGAVFGVYTEYSDADAGNDNYYTNGAFGGTVTTDDTGRLLINGLDEGTYYLKEITAPAGFIKDGNVYQIDIDATWNKDTYKETLDDGCEVEYDVMVIDTYTITISVVGEEGSVSSTYSMTLSGPTIEEVKASDDSTQLINTKGVELPATGGMGTTIFYIIGSILVIGAGIILVTRRRMNL